MNLKTFIQLLFVGDKEALEFFVFVLVIGTASVVLLLLLLRFIN